MLRESARVEYEAARFEQDPEIVRRDGDGGGGVWGGRMGYALTSEAAAASAPTHACAVLHANILLLPSCCQA